MDKILFKIESYNLYLKYHTLPVVRKRVVLVF
jgi:hypothetical protein